MSIIHIFLAFLLLGPIAWSIYNKVKYKDLSAPKGIVNYATFINSALLYALAFNIIFFLQEVFLVLGKKIIGLKAFLYHNNHEWVGEHPMISLMQGSGALAIFLIGLICLAILHRIRNSKSIWKLFILWLAFHGLIQSIPQVMIAYLDPGTDVGDALIGYFNLSQPVLISLATISFMAIIMLSSWFSKPLMEFISTDADLSNPKVKFKYLGFIALGAGLAGSLLVVPFRIPPASQAITPFIVFFISVPWTWSSAAINKPVRGTSNKINEKIFWSPALFLLLLLIFFQFVLAPGVMF